MIGLPDLAKRPDAQVIVVEGNKARLAAQRKLTGQVAVTWASGTAAVNKTNFSPLRNRDVILWPDADEPGRKAMAYVAQQIGQIAKQVRIVDTNSLPKGYDVADHDAEGEKLAEWLQERFREYRADLDVKPKEEVSPNRDQAMPSAEHLKVPVKLSVDEHSVIDAVIGVLAERDAGLYQRSGMLVRVLRNDVAKDGIQRARASPAIRQVPAANLRTRITRHVMLERFDQRAKDWMVAHPPLWLVHGIDAHGEWPGIRPLESVSSHPVLRDDGSVWQKVGYDARTLTLYDPNGVQFPAVPDNPTLGQAQEAAGRLLAVVGDFPFAGRGHRSAWLSAVLTPMARQAFKGPTPLFTVIANIRGSGKTLLARVAGMINLGHELPVSSYAHDAEEMRKRITATAIAGDRMLLLDNVDGKLGNDALDRALTSTTWSDRILGKSERLDLPWLTTMMATGNNVQIEADTARRIIPVRLDVLDERPEHRAGFQHTDLIGYVGRHRPELLVDGLTVLSAYLRAGKPKHGLRPFGSFEGWSSLVREAIVWVGLADPCDTQRELDGDDEEVTALSELLHAWRDYDPMGHGFAASELLRRLYPSEYQPKSDDAVALRSAIEGICRMPHGKAPGSKKLGYVLRRYKRRVADDMYLESTGKGKAGSVWVVRKAESPVLVAWFLGDA